MPVVDLAVVVRAAIGHRGDLHVADDRQVPPQPPRQVTLGRLHMVAIEHQPQVRVPGPLDQPRGLAQPGQEVARRVVRVQGLDQEGEIGGHAAGVVEVGESVAAAAGPAAMPDMTCTAPQPTARA